MTSEQINEAIAEACGIISKDQWGSLYRTLHGIVRNCPDYCNDLNAMHEAEKVLVGKNNWELCEYVHKLHTATNSWIAFATARQRAEAFLRTLGKWEEA